MSENKPSEESLREQFETLGRNLVEALRTAWEAPESRRAREEVITGLNDLGTTLKREAENLAAHPVAQKVQKNVGEVGEKLRTPEVQEKVRKEMIGALQTVNTELQKVIDRWSAAPATTKTGAEAPAPEQPGVQSPDFPQPAPGQTEMHGPDTPDYQPVDQA